MEMKFKDIEVSDRLDQVVENSLQELRGEKQKRLKHKWIAGGCGMAAAFACAITLGITNPSYATNIPVIGHVFEMMQDKFAYGGDYNGIGTQLTEENVAGDEEQSNEYTQTVDGVTVTLSEIYCNNAALYLSMEIHSEQPFPDMYAPQLFTSEQYSFNQTKQGDAVILEGDLVDANTYAGLVRFDLSSKVMDDSEYMDYLKKSENEGKITEFDSEYTKHLKKVDIPETFTLNLSIDEIRCSLKNPPEIDYGKTAEEMESMSDEEWHDYMTKWYQEHPDAEDSQEKIYAGPWNFTLDVDVNSQDTQVVDLKDKAQNGIGLSAITKDRFEISVYSLNEDQQNMGDYFPVILDADGRLMDYGDGGSVCTVAINDSDVSQVDVFLIDASTWLGELKGHWWKTEDGLTDPQEIKEFKQLLLDNCAYHTEVSFE